MLPGDANDDRRDTSSSVDDNISEGVGTNIDAFGGKLSTDLQPEIIKRITAIIRKYVEQTTIY